MGGPITTEQLYRINYTFAIIPVARKPCVTSSLNLFLESLGILSSITASCKILLSTVYELSKEQEGAARVSGCAGQGEGAGTRFAAVGPTWQNQRNEGKEAQPVTAGVITPQRQTDARQPGEKTDV